MSFATSESVGDLNQFMLQFGVNGEQSKTEFHVEYPSFKRPRKDEIASPRVGMPVVANKLISCNVFKTKMCEQFRLGCCIYGDKCTYAHGIGDIRKPVPHCEGLVQGEHYVKIWDEEPRMINRMKVCTIFYRGEMCPYGDRCHFLHKAPNKFRKDSGRFRQRFARSIAATGCSRGPITGSDSACTNRSLSDHVAECKGYANLSLNADCLYPKPIYWKTKLCHKWETTGDCSYGEKCIFAHGKAGNQFPSCLHLYVYHMLTLIAMICPFSCLLCIGQFVLLTQSLI